MRLKGKTFTGPNTKIVAFPRPNEDAVFILQAVLNYDEFDKIVPRPVPPVIAPAGENKELPINDLKDPKFREQMKVYAEYRIAWYMLQSLKATPGLEWDTVKSDDPETWPNWRKELKDAFFSDNEIAILEQTSVEVNSLDEELLEKARNRFTAGTTQAQQAGDQFLTVGPQST